MLAVWHRWRAGGRHSSSGSSTSGAANNAATHRSFFSPLRRLSTIAEDEEHARAPLVFAAVAYPTTRPSLPRPRTVAGAACLLLCSWLVWARRDAAGTPSTDDVLRHALDLTAIQTQIVHRHGDRTPITPLKDEAFWSTLLPSRRTLDGLARHTNVTRRSDFTPHPAGGGAVYGRLTGDGLDMMRGVGAQLRSEVVARLMPGRDLTELEDVEPSTWLRVASTDFSRTIQSVQALLSGLLPAMPRAGIIIDARHTLKMIPDPNPRLYVGQAERERELMTSSDFAKKEDAMKPLATRVTAVLFDADVLGEAAANISFGVGEDEAVAAAETPTDLGSASDARRRILPWNQLAEILICLNKRDRLPKGITPQDLEDVAEHNAWRWFALLSDAKLAAMAIKSLAKKMILNGAEAVHASSVPAPLLHIFSAHDATLISLLCFFRIERPFVWPEYGSYLKMELLRDDKQVLKAVYDGTEKERLYILFSLNGTPLRSMFGRKNGSNSTFFVPWLNFARELETFERGLPPLALHRP